MIDALRGSAELARTLIGDSVFDAFVVPVPLLLMPEADLSDFPDVIAGMVSVVKVARHDFCIGIILLSSVLTLVSR